MQNPAGHRINMHNGDFKEAGIGVINGTNGSVGPQIVTQDLGYPGDVTYLTGVVFEDLNSNSFYDIGEGRSGVRIDVDGSPFYAISSDSGGYSIPVFQDGSYDLTFSGGGFATMLTSATAVGGENVKVDYLVSALLLAGDYNGDGFVDAADYTVWRDTLGSMSDLRANGDNTGASTGIIDAADYVVWKTHFGETAGSGTLTHAAVPEPSTLALLAFSLCGIAVLRPAARASPSLFLRHAVAKCGLRLVWAGSQLRLQ